jgi:glycosyltransferase involved in cell wall biosynthesis
VKLSVAIDGLNLGAREGTGIATYARELARSLLADGHSVSVIYGLDRVSNGVTRPFEFLQQLSLVGEPEGERLRRTRHRLAFWALWYAPRHLLRWAVRVPEVQISADTQLCSPEKLPPRGARVFNARMILRCSQTYAALGMPALKIKLPVKPDILHLTYPVPITIPGVKQVCTIHDVIPFVLPDSTTAHLPHFHNMLRAALAKSDLVFAISEQTKRDLISHFEMPEDRVHLTYQAVDVPKTILETPEEELERFLRGNYQLERGNYYVYFGAIEPKKNVLRILEALKTANISRPLVLIGRYAWLSDEVRNVVKQLEARRCDDGRPRLIRMAHLPRQDLFYVVRGARCALFPSLYEGFGLPVLEAMQLGCPVITSNVSSLPEVCGDAALYVDPYDVRALRLLMEHVDRNDDVLQEMKAKGVRQANRYSAAAYLERVREGYAKVLNRAP